MNKRYIDYALYNIWANNRLISDLLQHEDAILTKELVGSFSTIRTTLQHIWYAEVGWLSRLNEKGWQVSKVTEFTGSNKELFKAWQATSEEFKNFTLTVDLDKDIVFKHKGQSFSIPSSEIIQTVFNHGSFHRGQVVMMMRQLGVTQITQTDYIEWVREKERGHI